MMAIFLNLAFQKGHCLRIPNLLPNMNSQILQSIQKSVRRQQALHRQEAAEPQPLSEALQQYLQERVEQQRQWFAKRASDNKSLFMNNQRAIIVLGAITPIMALLLPLFDVQDKHITALAAVFSAGISILAGFDKLGSYQTNWYSYRMSEELLKKEQSFFQHRAGVYAEMDEQAERERLFVERVEHIIAVDLARFSQQQPTQSSLSSLDLDLLLGDDDDGPDKKEAASEKAD
jgi:hypothetical protein